MTFGETLAIMRGRRGISQNRLAREVGYDQSYLSRLEDDKREPSRETVTALADALAATEEETARLLVSAGFWPGDAAARAYLTAVGVWA